MLTRFPGNSLGIVDPDGPFAAVTSIGSVIGFIGGGSSKSSSASSPPFCSCELVTAVVSSLSHVTSTSTSTSCCSSSSSSSLLMPSSPSWASNVVLAGRLCSMPLGNLKRLSELLFFKDGPIKGDDDVDTVTVLVFSTLPWLSLRKGGGSHFRL